MASAQTGVEHLQFQAGPYRITPGANLILLQSNKVPKPTQDGYMVRFQPNLVYAKANGKCCGKVPMVSRIHLHHGVWLSDGAAGEGEGNSYGFYPFAAVGEEKTIFQMPAGYGYPVAAKDAWVLNYMIHNLTARPYKVYITYNVDFIPSTSPAASKITPVHPIWMDVEDHNIYPVFNVAQHSGVNGKFTFPDMANDPYGNRAPLNEFKIDHPGTLIATAGHLHPGGLYNTLDLIRSGATPSGGAVRGGEPNSVRLFRSYAHYWDKRGPISWNLSMTGTSKDWHPEVKAGDTLRTSVTYDTRRASWYEVMGIMVVWEAWNVDRGVDPFTHKVDQTGHVTHGYLPENNDNGGSYSLGLSTKNFSTCHPKQVVIKGFIYKPGDFTSTGKNRCVPTITQGNSLMFDNEDAQGTPKGQSPFLGFGTLFNPPAWYTGSIFHSITSCKSPCGLNTGISYPLANAAGFDSGQLGPATPASGSIDWSTPTNLKPGTYTYFCRIHPFMRGVFRVIK